MISAGQQEFVDSLFRILDDADSTKKLAFQLSGISTGQERTITVPDADGTLVFAGSASHDGFSDFVANEHIDWTAAAAALYTTGSGRFDGGIFVGVAPTAQSRLYIVGSNATDPAPIARIVHDANSDARFVLQAKNGAANKRFYFEWRDHTDSPKWFMGKNAGDSFILYDYDNAVHRLSALVSGETRLDSITGKAVQINKEQGTEGLEIYDGGAGSAVLWTTIKDGGIDTIGAVEVGGLANESQLIVRANSSQSNSNPLLRFKDSDGVVIFDMTSDHVSNVFIGNSAGANNTAESPGAQDGIKNVFIGDNTGLANISGSENIGLGENALRANQAGDSNLAIGNSALYTLNGGTANVAIGTSALFFCVGATGNVAIGASTLRSATSSYNTGVGDGAFFSLSSGGENVGIGRRAGVSITTGSDNTLIGYRAGESLAGADSGSVMIGHEAGYYETASNKLFIDYDKRANEADARVKALIYGVFAATPADQVLVFNAKVDITGRIKSSGGRILNTTRITGNTTLDATHHNVFADTDGGSFIATLPAGADGTHYRIINSGSSGENLTVTPDGAELLIGVNSSIILTDGQVLVIVFETTEGWW